MSAPDPAPDRPIGLGAWLDPDPAATRAGADARADSGTGTDADGPMRFPCRFPIKAMGRADSDIAAVVLQIISRHAPAITAAAMTTRPSRGGKWLAVTVTINASSRAQLDAIYRELTAHELVIYAL